MSNSPVDGEVKEISKRFRRLLDSDESKGVTIENPEQITSEVAANDQPSTEKESNLNVQEQSITEQNVPPLAANLTTPKQEIEKSSNELALGITSTTSNFTYYSHTNSDYEQEKLAIPIDEYGMPLPGRNRNANRLSVINGSTQNNRPSITESPALNVSQKQPDSKHKKHSSKKHITSTSSKTPHRSISAKQGMGCLLRMVILAMIAGIILLIAGGSFVVYEYYKIAASLPSVADLEQKASTFETTRIYDRNGNLLYEILDPSAGRRTFITLDKISPYLVAATIATEDKSFYSHPGFDWTAILRAFWQNINKGETVSGASTITQQLARNLLLSPEERTEQSYMRKVREALLAAEITRRYSKDQILELYLNEFYYGNLAYGIEAASETYFNIPADQLDLSQASFLAGLPQAPSIYDVYNNREVTRERQKQVLTLMYEASNEQGCIYVSNNPQRVCVDTVEAVDAYTALENYQFNPPYIQMRHPHWVTYIRALLESQFDAQTIYRSGFSIYTTIDPDLQEEAERLVKEQVDSLANYNANDGALVAINPSNGEILAMVGSADFYNEAIDGQVNMAISPTRQPGSSIKPITYLAAFEKGWTPASLIWDVPSEFPPSGDPNDPRPPYIPVNYDGQFHGPVTVRSALANSYNIPAVKALDFAGIYDNPDTPNEDGMISMAHKLGITSLTRSDYGLSLTLGGGEVSLLEMAGAYSAIANGGRYIAPVAISRILDHNGNIVFENQPSTGDQVIRQEHAFLISSILSDNEARSPMFGANSILNLPFQVAAKTGTSNDYRDNWTLGYTPDLAVGVWVGNADYEPMQDVTGLTGAAPIWSKFVQYAVPKLTNGSPTQFSRPSGIIDKVICVVSGTEPSEWCPEQRSEFFASDQLPLPSSLDLWTKVLYDTWTGFRASSVCAEYTKEEYALNITDPWAIGWIQNDAKGKTWAEGMGFNEPFKFAPIRECRSDDPHPMIDISSPTEGQTITISPLDITGKIDVSVDFQNFKLEYGIGDNPVEWIGITEGNQPVSQHGKFYSWDLKSIPPGVITLRITMNSIRGGYAERKIHLNIQVPTPTPTMTMTMVPTSTRTPSPTNTATPVATETPIPTASPTITQAPVITETPTPTNTPEIGRSP